VSRAFSQCLSDAPPAVRTLKQPALKTTFKLFPSIFHKRFEKC